MRCESRTPSSGRGSGAVIRRILGCDPSGGRLTVTGMVKWKVVGSPGGVDVRTKLAILGRVRDQIAHDPFEAHRIDRRFNLADMSFDAYVMTSLIMA
jgi:hypothetical protein